MRAVKKDGATSRVFWRTYVHIGAESRSRRSPCRLGLMSPFEVNHVHMRAPSRMGLTINKGASYSLMPVASTRVQPHGTVGASERPNDTYIDTGRSLNSSASRLCAYFLATGTRFAHCGPYKTYSMSI